MSAPNVYRMLYSVQLKCLLVIFSSLQDADMGSGSGLCMA